ncbi:MAG: T9SS type A sorting domain-containing protein [Bacteroidetes bacterium]|nr:T9SS type A sorting domain-containing protein [Bacteroidota bacterium]
MKNRTLITKLKLAMAILLAPSLTFAQVTANNDSASVLAGNTVNINVLANDLPTAGSFVITENTSPSNGTLVKNANNTFSYTAPAGFSGTVSFTYTIRACGTTVAPAGHSYVFVSAPGIKWTDALVAAESAVDPTGAGRKGYLATITSEAENVLAYAATQFLLPNGQSYGHPSWLGGSDASEEGVWRWMTGPEAGMQFSGQDLTFASFVDGYLPQLPCGYHKWAKYEPNNSNGVENYLHLQGQNQWNDYPNQVNTADIDGYLVEFGGLEDSDPDFFSTATVTITVGSPTPPATNCITPTISITPANCTYTGGDATKMYLGYGSQKSTLKVSAVNGYTYTWKRNGTVVGTGSSYSFTPTSAGNYTFTVTASNANGCSVTSNTASICVKDIRVPNTCGWVYVCYTPSFCNPNNNSYTLYMPTCLVPLYMCLPGSKLGTCSMICGSNARMMQDDESTYIKVGEFEAKAYPNPSNGRFSLEIPFSIDNITVRMVDISGRMIDAKEIKSGETRKLDYNLQNMQPGMYLIQITDGIQSITEKVFIQP